MSAAEYNDPRLKFLPARPAFRAALLTVAIPATLLAVASLPWRAERVPVPPRVVASARGAGGLSAGAAEVRFALPEGVPIAGFSRLSYASEGSPGPVGARALVLSAPGCTVALASAEIVFVPEALEAAVRARISDLDLAGLVLVATHTHAGPGGYWEHPLGERMATGPYDAKARDAIAGAIAAAIRHAAGALAPARVAIARGRADDLARSRSGGEEDAPLTVLRLERTDDGAPLAELTVFAAHATLLGKRNRTISGDWPGRFLAGGTHGLRLLVPGAIGDQSVDGPDTGSPEAYAAALSGRVESLAFDPPEPAPRLAFAAVEVGLPALQPGAAPALLRRAARNLVAGALPATARIEALRIGPALLIAVPGEPVAAVAARWRAELPEAATVVSLADGYLGYVEAPERMAARGGETVRTYYGPGLAARLGAGVRTAAGAIARGGAANGAAAASGSPDAR